MNPTYPKLAALLALTFGGTTLEQFATDYGQGDVNEAVNSFGGGRTEKQMQAAERGAALLLEMWPAGLPELRDAEFEWYAANDHDIAEVNAILMEND